MLDTFGLCACQEGNTQQYIRRQFAQYEHRAVPQHLPFVIDFLIDITDRRDARDQRTRVQDRQ